jgi:hypothetical protein
LCQKLSPVNKYSVQAFALETTLDKELLYESEICHEQTGNYYSGNFPANKVRECFFKHPVIGTCQRFYKLGKEAQVHRMLCYPKQRQKLDQNF